MPRVCRAINAYKIKPIYKSAESVFTENKITDYNEYLKLTPRLRLSETFAWMITNGVGLPKGQIPNFLEQHFGPRIVDISKDNAGNLVLENGLLHRKRRKLIK